MASAVVSVEKSASSMRLRASVRLVMLVVMLLTADSMRFCTAPNSARLFDTLAIAVSKASMLVVQFGDAAVTSTADTAGGPAVTALLIVGAWNVMLIASAPSAPAWIDLVAAVAGNSATPLNCVLVITPFTCLASWSISLLMLVRSVEL